MAVMLHRRWVYITSKQTLPSDVAVYLV